METIIYVKMADNRPTTCGLQMCFLIGLIYFICSISFEDHLKQANLSSLCVYLFWDGIINMIYSNVKRPTTIRHITISNRELQQINWKLKVKNIRYDEETECIICYYPNFIFSKFTNCTHTVCYVCLLKLERNECPFCRKLII